MGFNEQGIIFADLFVNSEEAFIKSFVQYYKSHQDNIDLAINNLAKVLQDCLTKHLTREVAENFEKAWDDFQKIVLLNKKDLELIVGYRDITQSGKEIQFSTIIPILDATSDGIIRAGSDAVRYAQNIIKQQEKAQMVETVLQDHVRGFIRQLQQQITKQEYKELQINHTQYIPKPWRGKWPNKDKYPKWQTMYYADDSNYYGGAGLGQSYDAYMNHIGNHHKELYDFLSTRGESNNKTIKPINRSVFSEEGETRQLPRLLYESLNRVEWYRGGDIVIVDPETNTVVYNIQLKTTGVGGKNNKTPGDFPIKIQKLKNWIVGQRSGEGNVKNQVGLLSAKTPEEKAKILFNELKIAVSNHNEFDGAVNKTAEQLIQLIQNKLNN